MKIRNYIFKLLFDITLKIRRENFYAILEEYEKNQYLPVEDLKSIQLKKLKSIINHARINVPYYKDKLPHEIESLTDLEHLPTLDKDTLRLKHTSLFTNYGHLKREKTSGGSTGAPVTIIKNSAGVACEMAASWRGYTWAGIEVGDRQARFWGEPRSAKEKARSKLIDFICHRIRISAFGYNEKAFRITLKRLENFKPDYFFGYTSIIEEFANFIESSNIEPNIKLKSIITTSEVLSKPTRFKIEKAFGQKVFDEYGCGEIGTIAHECEFGRLHLNMENSIVEIVDESGAAAQKGDPGEIVVTDLTNFSMPLIRYKLKDYGVISDTPCECGRNLEVLDNVFGRQYDALINTAGDKFHGEFFLYIAEDAKKVGHSVSGIQFIQDSHNSIKINIVSENHNSALQDFITSRIKEDFDTSFDLQFNWTNEIPREKSGKLRVVKYEAETQS